MPHEDQPSASPLLLARAIGVIGLVGIMAGAFDIGYVQSALIHPGDMAATLRDVAAREGLFRLGYSVHVVELLLNIVGEVLGFILLRRVNIAVAGISLGCGFIGIAVEAASLVFACFPLLLATGGGAPGGFTAAQVDGLAALSFKYQHAALLLSWVFYGADELATGFLFFRSGFIPAVLGFMIGLSGLCYLVNGLLSFLAPQLDAAINPYILFPNLPGEGLSSLWLAVVGVNVSKWNAWAAGAAGRGRSRAPSAA